MANVLLSPDGMQEPTETPVPVLERDLDEVLRSLEVDLFAEPKKREREPQLAKPAD